MIPISIIIFLFFAVIAEIIGTMAGFGSATVLVPIASFLFDIKKAIGLVALFHFFGQLVDGVIWRKYIVWRIGIIFSLGGVVMAFLGAMLVAVVPGRAIEIGLGIFLVVYALFSIAGRKVSLPRNDWITFIAGGITGFIAGLIGTPGAVRTAFLSNFHLPKEYFLGTSFAIAFLIDLVRVGVYIQSGILDLNIYWWVAVLAVALIGSLIGKKFVQKINEPIFFTVINYLLLFAGIKFLLF